MDRKIKLWVAIWALMITADCALCQPESLWAKRYNMLVHGSILTYDGNFAFNGFYERGDDLYSVITKLDSVGETIWETVWESHYFYRHIIETPDSGLAIMGKGGQRGDDFMIKKFNMDGELQYS